MAPYSSKPNYFVKSSPPGKDDYYIWTDTSGDARVVEDGERYLRVKTGNSVSLYLTALGVDRYLKDEPLSPAVLRVSCKIRTRGREDWTAYGSVSNYFRIAQHDSSSTELKPEYYRVMKASDCQDWFRVDNFVYLPSRDYWWSYSLYRAKGSEIDIKDYEVTYYLLGS